MRVFADLDVQFVRFRSVVSSCGSGRAGRFSFSIFGSLVIFCIDAHGGRLWAEANEPRGAVFQLTLPGA